MHYLSFSDGMLKCSKYDRDSSLNWYFSPFYLLTRDCLHFVLHGPKLHRDLLKLCSWLSSHNTPIFFWCLHLVRGFFYSALSPNAFFSKISTDFPHAPLFHFSYSSDMRIFFKNILLLNLFSFCYSPQMLNKVRISERNMHF